jgi:hypothetical protein
LIFFLIVSFLARRLIEARACFLADLMIGISLPLIFSFYNSIIFND